MYRILLLLLLFVMPVSFAQSMISLEALTQRQPGVAQRESSSNPDLASNGDSRSIEPGQTLTLLDADGPGVITHFWNTIAALDPFAGRSVVLRIYYDGSELPGVQAPLGDFFGVGHGANKNFTSATVATSAEGLSRACYWQMPFQKHVRVTVSNESPTFPVVDFYFYLDWRKLEELPDNTLYFQAEYRQSMPAAPGHYTLLDTTGSGQYVGTVYSAQQVELGWFGEGDDFIYIDGAEAPQLRGTGTEDYFNDAWGFREFCTPYHGVSLYEGVFPGDRVTAYRWHVQDPIPFEKSLRVTIEHRGSVEDDGAPAGAKSLARSTERPDWVSSVAFWYQYPPKPIVEPLPPADKRIAPYKILPVGTLACRATPAETITPANIGITYITQASDATLEITFEIEQPGRYRIQGLFDDSIMGALWQPMLDGKAAGLPIDTIVPGSQFIWRDFDLHDLAAGAHTLAFSRVAGISPHARTMTPRGASITIEYLTLLRLEDMQGYHQLYDAAKARQQ